MSNLSLTWERISDKEGLDLAEAAGVTSSSGVYKIDRRLPDQIVLDRIRSAVSKALKPFGEQGEAICNDVIEAYSGSMSFGNFSCERFAELPDSRESLCGNFRFVSHEMLEAAGAEFDQHTGKATQQLSTRRVNRSVAPG